MWCSVQNYNNCKTWHWNRIVSCELEGCYHYTTLFRWEPEGRYRCTKSMAMAPFWFSTEHRWTALTARSGSQATNILEFSLELWNLNLETAVWCHCVIIVTKILLCDNSDTILRLKFSVFYHEFSVSPWVICNYDQHQVYSRTVFSETAPGVTCRYMIQFLEL